VFLGGPAESWSGARRWRGLQTAARARGLGATRHGPYSPTLAGGAAAADAAVASGATALVAHNDLLAIGVLGRLRERGVDVPGQVSVVGFDDIFGSSFCAPPLTTLAEQVREAGARAVESLLMQMQRRDRQPARVVLPTQLVVRGSTGVAG
jgi:LacI family transcriptional regulator